MTNRFITITRQVPKGRISEDDFAIETTAAPVIGDGEVLLHPVALTVDPFQRNLMSGEPHSVLPTFVPGRPLSGFGVAQVVESRHPDHAPGDLVQGWMTWADLAVWPNAVAAFGLQSIDPAVDVDRPSLALSIFAQVGVTAYYAVTEIGRVAAGETVLISSGAGGVGSLAGQIAKARGAARVVGLTSSQAKRDLLTDKLGFDLALDYRADDLIEQLEAALPGGPDVYLDNVGGELSTRIMRQMRYPARVVECGQLSNYDDADKAWTLDTDPLHTRGLTYHGFMPTLFRDDWSHAYAQMRAWIDDGTITPVETLLEGLESLPSAIVGLFTGAHVGKVVVTAPRL